ncbi:hypothetical protein Prudu_008821, partial [Prunus dulcis]
SSRRQHRARQPQPPVPFDVPRRSRPSLAVADPSSPCRRRKLAIFADFAPELQATRSPPFLNQISRAPGVRLIHRRDPREAVEERRKPPGHQLSSRPTTKVGDSAEFSAEVRRKLIKERAKRSFVPDIRQVSDTHRSRLDFQKRKLG